MAIASKFFSKRFLERVPGIVKVIWVWDNEVNSIFERFIDQPKIFFL
jgi:hypothetical protein